MYIEIDICLIVLSDRLDGFGFFAFVPCRFVSTVQTVRKVSEKSEKMASTKSHPGGRSSSCLRKYWTVFVFSIIVLCVQIYLHTFFVLDNGKTRSNQPSSGEGDSSQSERDEGLPSRGLPKGQLKLPPDKQAGSDKQTLQSQWRNRTTRIKLDRNSLNFTPMCEVKVREAVSAVTRAQSQACKQRIVNVTCLSQQGLLYPERVQSLCPHSRGFTGMPANLGCFKDDKALRILSSYYHIFKGNNTPERCAFLCLQSGFPYAGTEYSVECFCGTEEPSQTKRLPDSSCNMKCSGNPRQTCGGYLTINVYSTGIQKFKPQEARNSSSRYEHEQQPVRIAYLLTVNGRASRQVKRLIGALYHPSHLFYIHVDARQDYLYREMLELEKSCKLNNIKVARGEGSRHASIWGGASLLTTFLRSAQRMLAYDQHWDFLVNLSESDFPLKSNDRLTEFLGWNKGMNFAKSHGREVQRFVAKQGLDKTFVECEARMWRIGDRKLPDGIQIDGGSDWFALSREFVEYVANPDTDSLVIDLSKLFRYTLLPAESFFHTVLRNSRFCNTYIDNNLHMTNWKRKLGCKCQYKAVVDWCGCSPNDFKLEDFNRLRNTADRNIYFGRKFEPVIDHRIIDRLEEWLYPNRMNKTRGNDMYWQSLYHHADLSPLPDDVLLTLSYSLARLVYRGSQMARENIRLLENTAYFRDNRFVGILIRAKSEDDSPNDQVEALVSMRHNFSTSRSWSGRIRSLSVNTDYDQKEQTFRNFAGGIGPYSSPVLAYEFDAGITVPQNVSVLWIDPHGRLADANHILVEEMTLIGHIKPQLNEQLIVGTWRVLLVADTELIAKFHFLVIPLSYWKTKKIDSEKAKEIMDGPSSVYHVTEEMNRNWSRLVRSAMTNEETTQSQSKMGENLDDWLDRLVHEHYEIERVCAVTETGSRIGSKLQKCIDTHWSSLSPDSKADTSNLCQNY